VGADKLTRKFQIETDRNAIGVGRKGGWCAICTKEIGDKPFREAKYFMYWAEDENGTPYDYIDKKARTDNRSCGYLCATHDRRKGRANLMRFGYDKATAIKINEAICSDNHSYWNRYGKEYNLTVCLKPAT